MTGLPEPRANPLLLGHAAAEAAFAQAMRSGRMHHAWLILGPAGIGKATLAFRVARRILAGAPAGRLAGQLAGHDLALGPEHPVFRRVAAGSHADLLTVERVFDEKKKKLPPNLLVDDVRALPAFMHLTPAEGGWRVVVVDGADSLNRNAANALLKAVEEPPPRTLLLLVCIAAGRLPATLRSRCRRLTLAPLSPADTESLLARARPEIAPAERAALAARANGSIGRALELTERDDADLLALARRTLREPLRLRPADALAAAEAVGRDESAFATFIAALRAGLADAVRAAARGHPDPARNRMLGSRALADWVVVWQALGTLSDMTTGLHLELREAVHQGFKMLARGADPAWPNDIS